MHASFCPHPYLSSTCCFDAHCEYRASRLMLLQVTLLVDDGVLVDGEGGSSSLLGDQLLANNGYAHAVDGVLFPADLVTMTENINAKGGSFEGVFDIFLAGLERANLSASISGLNGPYTVSCNNQSR